MRCLGVRSNRPSRFRLLRWLLVLGLAVLLRCGVARIATPPAPPALRVSAGSAQPVLPAAPRARPAPEIVALDPFSPSHLIVDDGFVYWISQDGQRVGIRPSQVMRAPKGGGAVTTLAEGQQIRSLVADDANLYWTELGELDLTWPGAVHKGAVRRVSKHGGRAFTLAARRDSPGDIAAGAGHVYWLESDHDFDPMEGIEIGAVMTIDSSGAGRPRRLDASAELGLAWLLRLDPSRLFVAEDTSRIAMQREARARRLPHPPSKPDLYRGAAIRGYALRAGKRAGKVDPFYMSYDASERCVQGAPCGGITSMAASGGRVVWGSAGVIMASPVDGGASVMLAISPGLPTGIAIDDRYVYWGVHSRGRGQVLRVALGGGTAEVLADGLDWLSGVAVDRDHVYWAEPGAGKIVRIPKP